MTEQVPAATETAAAAVVAERIEQLKKYPIEHDRLHGVHHLVTEAQRRVHSASCGYYHRTAVIEAAALMLAAVESMDRLAATHDDHDERTCTE